MLPVFDPRSSCVALVRHLDAGSILRFPDDSAHGPVLYLILVRTTPHGVHAITGRLIHTGYNTRTSPRETMSHAKSTSHTVRWPAVPSLRRMPHVPTLRTRSRAPQSVGSLARSASVSIRSPNGKCCESQDCGRHHGRRSASLAIPQPQDAFSLLSARLWARPSSYMVHTALRRGPTREGGGIWADGVRSSRGARAATRLPGRFHSAAATAVARFSRF
jgi:hypothetical protein